MFCTKWLLIRSLRLCFIHASDPFEANILVAVWKQQNDFGGYHILTKVV